MINVAELKHEGDFKKTDTFLGKLSNGINRKFLEHYGKLGVEALHEATPKATGKTSQSWSYVVENSSNGVLLNWNNSNVVNGANVAMLIQKGHGTASGTYVQGIDYINPALEPIYESIKKHKGMDFVDPSTDVIYESHARR